MFTTFALPSFPHIWFFWFFPTHPKEEKQNFHWPSENFPAYLELLDWWIYLLENAEVTTNFTIKNLQTNIKMNVIGIT